MQPLRTMSYQFDDETAARQVGPDHWQMTLSPHWNINDNPNGGYLLAPLLRAMQSLSADSPDPVSVTTHYLRPGLSGELADIRASVVRTGRRTSTISGTLSQQGKERIVCTATFATLPDSDAQPADDERVLSIAPPDLPPPDQCTPRAELGQGVELPILSRVDVRVAPDVATPGQSSQARMAGWIRLRDQRPLDALVLPLLTDAFPPSVFSLYGRIGWVPTLELGVHIRRRPRPGWIKAVFNTRDLAGDLYIEDGMLWDEADRLVAQSRQLQMILTG
jgi:acyl-CoA thioesterase